jgi:hypothetical protein
MAATIPFTRAKRLGSYFLKRPIPDSPVFKTSLDLCARFLIALRTTMERASHGEVGPRAEVKAESIRPLYGLLLHWWMERRVMYA